MADHDLQGVRTVQATSKKWKGIFLIGWGVTLAGFVLMLATREVVFAAAIFAGLGIVIGSKITAWWHHG